MKYQATIEVPYAIKEKIKELNQTPEKINSELENILLENPIKATQTGENYLNDDFQKIGFYIELTNVLVQQLFASELSYVNCGDKEIEILTEKKDHVHKTTTYEIELTIN